MKLFLLISLLSTSLAQAGSSSEGACFLSYWIDGKLRDSQVIHPDGNPVEKVFTVQTWHDCYFKALDQAVLDLPSVATTLEKVETNDGEDELGFVRYWNDLVDFVHPKYLRKFNKNKAYVFWEFEPFNHGYVDYIKVNMGSCQGHCSGMVSFDSKHCMMRDKTREAFSGDMRKVRYLVDAPSDTKGQYDDSQITSACRSF